MKFSLSIPRKLAIGDKSAVNKTTPAAVKPSEESTTGEYAMCIREGEGEEDGQRDGE